MQNVLYYIIISLFTMSTLWGQEKIRIAVLPFEGFSISQGEILARIFSQKMARNNLLVPLVRNETDVLKAMGEFEFQSTGLTSDQQKAKIGEAWNARYVLIADFQQLDSLKIFSVSVLDVETLSTKTGDTRYVQKIEEIPSYFNDMIDTISGDLFIQDNYSDLRSILVIYEGQESIQKIQEMITRGVNIKDKDNRTALMLASIHGYTAIIEYLLQNNARVNEKNNYSTTALMYAAQDGHLDTVQLLLKYGADKNMKSDQGNTALILADTNGHKKIVKLLQKWK